MRRPPSGSSVGTILVGTVLGQGLVIAVSPILTRSYSASDFGALAVVTAIASVLGAGATLGTDRAMAVAVSPRAVGALVWVGVAATGIVCCATAAVSWVVRGALADRFGAPALVDLWWVLPVTTAAIGAQRIASSVLARHRAHRSIAVRNICQGVGQTVWNTAMAFSGPLGLVGGLAAGRVAAIVGTVRPRELLARRPSRTALRDCVRQHRRFLWLTPWSAMLNVIGQQAPSLLLAGAYGSTAAGFVALTMRVLGAPVGMLADAVAQVAAGAFGARIRSGTSVRALVFRTVGRLVVLGAIAAVVVVVTGPAVFAAVFGPGWVVSGEYARILAPAFAVQVAVSPVTQVLSMLGRHTTQLVWDGVRLVATTTAVLVPVAIGWSMSTTLGCLTIAMVGAYAAMGVLVAVAVRSPGSTQ